MFLRFANGMGKKSVKNNQDHSSLSAADLESASRHESLAKKPGSRLHSKCRVHVHSRTHRLADEDGRSIKAALDGLRKGRLLEDDSPEFVSMVSQSQELTQGDEETIIDLIFEEDNETNSI